MSPYDGPREASYESKMDISSAIKQDVSPMTDRLARCESYLREILSRLDRLADVLGDPR